MLIEIQPGSDENTAALRKALKQIDRARGGTLRLLPGLHLSASLEFPSGLRLEICEGAILKALPEVVAMQAVPSPIPSRMDVVPWKTFLYAVNANNITLCGHGTIDGSGDAYCFQDGIENSPERPYGFHCIGSKRIRVENIHFKNSGFWMQRYFACQDVQISGITVYNHANKNNDGLDIDSSQNVVIENCRIDSSDDALCIKSEGKLPARNIRVENCTLSTHASAFKLGTGSVGGFEDITANDLRIIPSEAKEMRHPLGLSSGLSGIDLATVDGGAMRHVRIENVEMEGLQNPIFIRLGQRSSRSVALQGYGDGEDALQGVAASANDTEEGVGSIEDIYLHNIRGHDLGPYPIILCGVPAKPLRNIRLEKIDLVFARPGKTEDLNTPKDWNDRGYPMAPMFGTALPAYGLFTRHAQDSHYRELSFVPAQEEPRPEQSTAR